MDSNIYLVNCVYCLLCRKFTTILCSSKQALMERSIKLTGMARSVSNIIEFSQIRSGHCISYLKRLWNVHVHGLFIYDRF